MDRDEDAPWAHIKTIQNFDAGFECFENTNVEIKDSISSLPEVNLSSLLILCLIEQLCPFIEKDPAKAQRLNNVIVSQLQGLEFIDRISTSEEFKDLRDKYKDSLFQLVAAAQKFVAQEPGALLPKSLADVDEVDFGPALSFPRSRYSTEFETLGYINKGGFGEVYKVQNKLDGQQYAIKKILSRSQDLLTKTIQREVTVLASLHHPNIVKYHCAWIETVAPIVKPNNVTIVERRESLVEEINYHRNNDIMQISRIRDVSSGTSFIEFKDSKQDTPSTLEPAKSVVPKESGDSQIFSGDSISESTDAMSNHALMPANKLIVDQTILYIQMELCGITLREWMDSRATDHILTDSMLGKLQLRTSLTFFWQLVSALEYLHKNKIIHHDVKPGNIFVAGDSGIKLGDFGLACHYELSKEISHHAIGTYTYAAPEQLEGGLCNYKSDIYSCGMILLELIMPPFKTTSERLEVLGKLRKDGHVPDMIKKKFPQCEKVISAVTRRNPRRRPTADDLKQTSMKIISELPMPKDIEPPKKLGCIDESNSSKILASHVLKSQNFLTARNCSRQKDSTNTMECQMRALRLIGGKEITCEEVVSATMVGRVESANDMKQLENDELKRLRKENGSLRATVFMLEEKINFLKEQIRLQGVQLSMK